MASVSDLESPHFQNSCLFLFLLIFFQVMNIRELRNDDDNENVTWKYNFISFVLFRDYSNSLNFYRNGELSRNQIGRSGVQVKKENEKFTVCSCSPKNLEFGHFTLLFCRGRQEMYQNENAHAERLFLLLFCGVVVVVAVVVA